MPAGFLNEKSVCYLAGAGFDISFDLDIASKYKAQVHIFDPLPSSFAHFKDLESHVRESKSMLFKDGRYCIGREDFKLLEFHQLAFWNDNDNLNLQSTMLQLGHSKIDILKLRIGGREYGVLNNLLDNKLGVDVLCIRFEELHKPIDWQFIGRIRKYINRLKVAGYCVVSVDHVYNITFVRK